MKQCIILTIAPPGAGKSTWAERMVIRKFNNKRMFTEVNRDKLRREIGGFREDQKIESTQELERLVTIKHRHLIEAAIAKGFNVIVSDTNINPKTREYLYELAKGLGVPVFEKHFRESMDFDLLVHRNRTRPPEVDRIPHKVLRDFYIRYREQNFEKAYSKGAPEKSAEYPNANWMTHIFDIDGTIARHEGIRGPYDWHKVGNDLCYEDVADVARTMYESGYQVIIVSGRDGSCEELTREWLKKHEIPFHRLYMREAGNSMKDSIVKYDIFKKHIERTCHVVGVWDDRDQCVNLWRSIGLRCYQCTYGNF